MGSSGVGGSLSAASDVSLNSPSDNQVLKRQGGYWKNLADDGGLGNANITNVKDGQRLSYDSNSDEWRNVQAAVPLATFSIPGTLSAGTLPLKFGINGTWDYGMLLINLGTAPTGSSVVVDVLLNGTSIYGAPANRPTITSGQEWTSATASPEIAQFVGSSNNRSYLQCSITSVGGVGNEGKDLVAVLYATRTA